MLVQEANPADLWRLDTIGITDPIEKINKEEREARTREFVIETARQNRDGHYEVRLPWTEDYVPVSSNYDIARNRLKKCLDKLATQNLLEDYDSVFKEWLTEGIIERVPDGELDNFAHYLPHRPVVKENGTTKIRSVFDASACKKGHPSLNQCLERGPNLIELVPSSLNRFREQEIDVISDIKKTFLQIIVNRRDRDYLRFFWIENGELLVLRHCRVVFSLACSPFLLAASIDLHLSTFLKATNEMKDSAERLRKSFYVDNYVISVESDGELKTFVSEATTIMKAGGFELRDWESSKDGARNETTLVLGILWNKRRDTMSINPAVLKLVRPEVITKRTILSATHRIFDPIGFTCPTSVLPKLLLKQLWSDKINWDAKVTDKQAARFINWLDDLSALEQIEFPRKLGKGDLTLHTFCDASGTAYAAAVFARTQDEDRVSISLLSARSRIAPEKAIVYTIPRLELMAASIATRLTAAVTKSLTRKISRTTFWSDSTTVIA